MEKNNLYPIFIKLDRVNTLIVGGGNVGLEKVTFVLRQSPEARLKVVSPNFHPELIKLAIQNRNVQLIERKFQDKDLEGIKLLILATNNNLVNFEIQQKAKAHDILTNVVDNPSECEFYTAAVANKGSVKIAISSNGVSPTLAKRLRDILEEVIPDEVELSAEQLHQIRNRINGTLSAKIESLNSITQVLLQEDNPRSIVGDASVWANLNLN